MKIHARPGGRFHGDFFRTYISRSPQVPGIGPLPMPENGQALDEFGEVNRANRCQYDIMYNVYVYICMY